MSEASAARPRRWVRPVAIVAGLVVLLPIALLTVAAILLPTDLVARVATARAEAALGVPVAIADLELDFWPVPSVSLQGARLGPEGAPVATVEKILLRPRLLPLLRGRVTVREISIERPDIRLAVDSAGVLNLAFGGSDEDPAADPAPDGGPIDFAVDEFRIRDGRLAYSDARDGTRVVVNGLEQALAIEGRVAGGTLARVGLAGSISSDSVDADVPGRLAAPLRGVRFAVEHDAELDREADRLDLTSLRLELQRVALSGSGSIEAVSDSLHRSVRLELRAEEFSFDDLAKSLPEGFLAAMLAGRQPAGEGAVDSAAASGTRVETGYAGRAAITASVRGPLTRDSIPRVEGTVSLREVAVTRGGSPLLQGTSGSIDFSNDAVLGRELTGNLFGAPFALQFQVDDLAAPVAAFAARGTARVEDLLALVANEEPLDATGALPFDLRGRLEPANPVASVVEGTVELGGVRAQLSSLLQPVQVSSGTLRFAGSELQVEDVALAFGESRVRAEATVADWLPTLLGDSMAVAEVRFDARATTLDLDALLGPSESQYTPLLFARLADRPIGGKSAAEAATELGFELPELPRLRARGTLAADRLVRNGLTYEAVDLALESSPEAVSVPRLRFGLMGGTMDLGLALERGVDDATLVLVYHLENVGAAPFFARFTPFQGRLSGLMALDGEASLQLDRHMLPVRPTVRSSGQLALTSGSLASWPLLGKVGERLGLQSFDTLAFREWSGEFLVAGPLVSLERSLQVSDRVETELAGSFDFAGRLDLGVVSRLSPQLVAMAGEPVRAAASLASDEGGSVPVGLRITGTVTSPQIAVDLTAARDAALARARARATDEAEGAARRAAAEVARRALGDSAVVQPENIGEAVRGEVQDRIRGLFGRRGRAPAPAVAAPDDSAAATDSVGGGSAIEGSSEQ